MKENPQCKCGHNQEMHVSEHALCTKIGCWCNRFIEAKFQPEEVGMKDD